MCTLDNRLYGVDLWRVQANPSVFQVCRDTSHLRTPMPRRQNSPSAATSLQDGKPSAAHPANDKAMMAISNTLRMLSAVLSDIQHSSSVWDGPHGVEISRQQMKATH